MEIHEIQETAADVEKSCCCCLNPIAELSLYTNATSQTTKPCVEGVVTENARYVYASLNRLFLFLAS